MVFMILIAKVLIYYRVSTFGPPKRHENVLPKQQSVLSNKNYFLYIVVYKSLVFHNLYHLTA